MKRLIALLLVLFVAATAAGYVAYTALARASLAEASKGKVPDTTGPDKGAGPIGDSGPTSGSGAAGLNVQKIETVTLETAPAVIQDWVRNSLPSKFAGYRTVGKDLYLLVTAGPQPTTGYGVTLVSAGESNGRLEVVVRFTSPAKGTAQGQVITYPYALAKVPASTAFKTVEFVEEKPR